MIPDKLYIPTSTLNFNNIMSSESISPYNFYLSRGFGYKRFEKVLPNNLNNRILLYPKYPLFDIQDNDLENYPMVIEVETKYIKEDIIKEKNRLFYSDETIYLNPFSTKIIFRDKIEKIKTISKSEPSIESKMVKLYENAFTTLEIDKKIQKFNLKDNKIQDSNNDISKYVSEDRQINKLKGLIYAYLIASNKSVSSDIVVLKKNSRELKNILSAIITSPDSKASTIQSEKLLSIYNSINEKFLEILSYPLIEDKSEKYNCDFLKILIQEDLWETWLNKNKLTNFLITPFPINSQKTNNDLDIYIKELERKISSFENNQKKLKVLTSCLPVVQFNRILKIPEQKDFLVRLFSEFMNEAYNSEEFILSRYEFAMSGGKIFKDEMIDKWEGSQWQTYINSLLYNLNEHAPFNLKSTNNITLASFAAFCQKGEIEIEKLEDYLIANEIGDFRIAFGLWGIVFGFANMPKTLTDYLFLSNDFEYIAEIYNYIFHQIHGIELNGVFDKKSFENLDIDYLKKIIPEIEINNGNDNSKQYNQKENQDIISKLKNIKLNESQLDSLLDIYKSNKYKVDDIFYKQIKNIYGIGKKTMNKIIEALGNEINIKKKEIQTEIFSFDNNNINTEQNFLNDPYVYSYLDSIIPKKYKKEFIKDLKWFIEENAKYEKSTYYSDTKKDNISLINHFQNYIKKKKYNDKINIILIIEKLREIYK